MAEARRLKSGRWQLYRTPDLDPVRDRATGAILTFDSLPAARRWWLQRYPGANPPHEAIKCARCGAYFGRASNPILYGGLYYHLSHSPQAVEAERRRRRGG